MNTPSPPPPLLTNPDILTPSRCYVDFCLVPVGTSHASVALEVAAVQRLLAASGLKCTMHSAGTTVEGSWDEVMRVVGQAHSVVHEMGVVRIQTSMRVGTRTDKEQTAEQKIQRVEEILAQQCRAEQQQQTQQQQDERPT